MSKKVNIIGAGFSGLTAAYYLQQQGFNVHVYEKSETVGGLIQKRKCDYGFYETAANGIMGQAHILKFLNELGVQYRPSSDKAKKRFILRQKLKRWPLQFRETLKLIYKVLINFLVLKKHKKINYTQLSVASWTEQLLTTEAKKYLVEPGLKGIYAGHIEELSSRLIIKPLLQKKSPEFKSVIPLVSGQEGFHDILQQIKDRLVDLGVRIHLSTANAEQIVEQSLKEKTAVILATSAKDALSLVEKIQEQDFDLQKVHHFLKQIELVPIVSVTGFFKTPPSDQYIGFGSLFPQSEGLKPLGVLMNNVIFDRQSSFHSETWIFGGAVDSGVMQMTNEQFKEAIILARRKIFESEELPLDIKITRWDNALPHFTLKHENNLEHFTQHSLLKLHGNYLNVIGVSKIIVESQKLAYDLKEQSIKEILDLQSESQK